MKRVVRVLAATSLLLLAAVAWSNQEGQPATSGGTVGSETELSPATEPGQQEVGRPANLVRQHPIASLTIFVLAVFVGFEVITKVPPTLHTPLMSGSNAISGITLVGAVSVAAGLDLASTLGLLAVILASVNVVGGFLVTHRMLAMFRRDGGRGR